jgi:hypothetical protein
MLNNFINSVVTDNNKQNIPSGTFSSSLSNSKVGGNGSCGVAGGAAAKKRASKKRSSASKGGAINMSPFFSSLVLLGLRLATGEMKKKKGKKSGGSPGPMQIPSLEHFISENVKFSSGTPFEFNQPVVGGRNTKRRGGNTGGVPSYLNMSNTPFNDMEVNKFVGQPTILDELQDGGKRRSKSPAKRRGRKVKRGGEGDEEIVMHSAQDGGKRRSKSPAKRRGRKVKRGGDGDEEIVMHSAQDGGKRRSKSPAKRRGRKVRRGGEGTDEAHSLMNFQ